MDRCYKLKVLILVLTCVLIPTKLIYSNGKDVKSSKRQSSIQVENLSQQKKEVINITDATRLGYVQDVTADLFIPNSWGTAQGDFPTESHNSVKL